MHGLDHADIVDALGVELLDGLIDQGQCRNGKDRALARGLISCASVDATMVLPNPVGAATILRKNAQ
jgi:hypothetical protein